MSFVFNDILDALKTDRVPNKTSRSFNNKTNILIPISTLQREDKVTKLAVYIITDLKKKTFEAVKDSSARISGVQSHLF